MVQRNGSSKLEDGWSFFMILQTSLRKRICFDFLESFSHDAARKSQVFLWGTLFHKVNALWLSGNQSKCN